MSFSTLIFVLLSTEKVGSMQAGQRHLFPFSSVLTQASENKEVYLVRECSVKSCKDAVKTSSELLPSFSYSLPILPVVPRPQVNHPHVDFDPTCSPSVQVSSVCMIVIFLISA